MSASGLALSNWWPRVGAFLLDVLILIVPFLIVAAIAQAASGNSSDASSPKSATPGIVTLVATAVISGLYFGLLNGLGRGQTVGNRAAGIGVRDARSGVVVGVGRSLLRWFVRYLLYVFVIPGILSDLWPLWDSQHQTIADKAAGTVMVKVP